MIFIVVLEVLVPHHKPRPRLIFAKHMRGQVTRFEKFMKTWREGAAFDYHGVYEEGVEAAVAAAAPVQVVAEDGMVNGLQGGRERGEQAGPEQGEGQSHHDAELNNVVAIMRAMQKDASSSRASTSSRRDL